MSVSRIVLLVIGLAAVCTLAAYQIRNPEKRDLGAAARASAGGQFVQLSDGFTHYDVAGPDSGQRVMLVHGFSVPSYIWDSTVAALTTAGFRVARYDVYGRGFSDRPDVAYNSDRTTRQLQQLLDSLGWHEPVDLVGLSMGGPLTAAFVASHPERVRSLTLVDPAAGSSGTVPILFRLPIVGRFFWQLIAVPGMADGQLSDFVEPAKWPDWPARYRVQMQYRGFGRALLSTLIEAQGRSTDSLYAHVGASGIPTLLIWGKEDQTVRIANADGVRKAIPQVRFHPIDHAGHLPHMERTDVVNPLLIEFLRGARSTPTDTSSQKS